MISLWEDSTGGHRCPGERGSDGLSEEVWPGHAEGRDRGQVLKPKRKSQRGKVFLGGAAWNEWGSPRAGVLCRCAGCDRQILQVDQLPRVGRCLPSLRGCSVLPGKGLLASFLTRGSGGSRFRFISWPRYLLVESFYFCISVFPSVKWKKK